jgi:hypothetical protein
MLNVKGKFILKTDKLKLAAMRTAKNSYYHSLSSSEGHRNLAIESVGNYSNQDCTFKNGQGSQRFIDIDRVTLEKAQLLKDWFAAIKYQPKPGEIKQEKTKDLN